MRLSLVDCLLLRAVLYSSRVRIRIRFSVPLVSGYAHVVVLYFTLSLYRTILYMGCHYVFNSYRRHVESIPRCSGETS